MGNSPAPARGSRVRLIVFAAIVCCGAVLLPAATATSAAPGPGERDRAAVQKARAGSGPASRACLQIRRRSRAAGLDPSRVLARELTLGRRSDRGAMRRVDVSVLDVCRHAQRLAARRKGRRGSGAAGTPEVAGGLNIHFYVNTTFFRPSALAYRVRRSKTVPPTPGLGGLPGPLAAGGLLVPGGRPVQVKGRGWDFGFHARGIANVDTAAHPKYGIWLPLLTGKIVADRKIDFAGKARVAQDQTCIPPIMCIAVGVVIGSGAATYGASPAQLPPIP